jgi:tyrosyl-tRNA synthetase
VTGSKKWSQVLSLLKEIESGSEAERVIKQGGMEINGKIVNDPASKLDYEVPGVYEVRLGKKKFFRLVVE